METYLQFCPDPCWPWWWDTHFREGSVATTVVQFRCVLDHLSHLRPHPFWKRNSGANIIYSFGPMLIFPPETAKYASGFTSAIKWVLEKFLSSGQRQNGGFSAWVYRTRADLWNRGRVQGTPAPLSPRNFFSDLAEAVKSSPTQHHHQHQVSKKTLEPKTNTGVVRRGSLTLCSPAIAEANSGELYRTWSSLGGGECTPQENQVDVLDTYEDQTRECEYKVFLNRLAHYRDGVFVRFSCLVVSQTCAKRCHEKKLYSNEEKTERSDSPGVRKQQTQTQSFHGDDCSLSWCFVVRYQLGSCLNLACWCQTVAIQPTIFRTPKFCSAFVRLWYCFTVSDWALKLRMWFALTWPFAYLMHLCTFCARLSNSEFNFVWLHRKRRTQRWCRSTLDAWNPTYSIVPTHVNSGNIVHFRNVWYLRLFLCALLYKFVVWLEVMVAVLVVLFRCVCGFGKWVRRDFVLRMSGQNK